MGGMGGGVTPGDRCCGAEVLEGVLEAVGQHPREDKGEIAA